jgi:hypothetical protein
MWRLPHIFLLLDLSPIVVRPSPKMLQGILSGVPAAPVCAPPVQKLPFVQSLHVLGLSAGLYLPLGHPTNQVTVSTTKGWANGLGGESWYAASSGTAAVARQLLTQHIRQTAMFIKSQLLQYCSTMRVSQALKPLTPTTCAVVSCNKEGTQTFSTSEACVG